MKLRHSRRTANSSPSARSGAPASRRIAGTSTSTIAPLPPKRTLFETQDLSVLEFTYAPDGASIWFTAAEKGTHNLHVVPVTDGAPRIVAKGGAISAPRAGRGIVDVLEIEHDVAGGRLRAGRRRQRLHAADHARERDAREGGRLADAGICDGGSAGGTPSFSTGCSPPGFDPSRKHPAVFLIHGGPQGAWDDAWSSRWNPALWAARGWVIVAPNPRGSTGFGQTFVDEISQDWSGKVMVDLEAVFDTASRLPCVDGGRAYCRRELRRLRRELDHRAFDRFKAAVSHDGVFNLESMALTTEELWFSEWEFGGPAWSETARQNFAKASPHLHVQQDQDDARDHQRARLPRAGRSGPSAVHRAATQRGTPRGARVSRRGALGASAAQQQALARRRVRMAEQESRSVTWPVRRNAVTGPRAVRAVSSVTRKTSGSSRRRTGATREGGGAEAAANRSRNSARTQHRAEPHGQRP